MKKPEYIVMYSGSGDPKENRTPDSALRGQRLNRLTIGPSCSQLAQVE